MQSRKLWRKSRRKITLLLKKLHPLKMFRLQFYMKRLRDLTRSTMMHPRR